MISSQANVLNAVVNGGQLTISTVISGVPGSFEARVTGTGLKPGSTVTATNAFGPAPLYGGTVGGDGTFTGSFITAACTNLPIDVSGVDILGRAVTASRSSASGC
ncbi:MAG TPA: hypothetical protein VGN35_12940 [Jatrophihabitantaceae bacterium]|nr:hypothetical protein [Jatrophihabitantaceae bacterium]